MSRARKVKKRLRLIIRQVMILAQAYDANPIDGVSRGRFILIEMSQRSPYEAIRQDRHERRVFGHNTSLCACTSDDIWNMIAWNQPPNLWMGCRVHVTENEIRIERGYDGRAYRQRILHRRKR